MLLFVLLGTNFIDIDIAYNLSFVHKHTTN